MCEWYMYVYMYVCVYVCVHICIYIYIYIYACVHVCTYVCMYNYNYNIYIYIYIMLGVNLRPSSSWPTRSLPSNSRRTPLTSCWAFMFLVYYLLVQFIVCLVCLVLHVYYAILCWLIYCFLISSEKATCMSRAFVVHAAIELAHACRHPRSARKGGGFY